MKQVEVLDKKHFDYEKHNRKLKEKEEFLNKKTDQYRLGLITLNEFIAAAKQLEEDIRELHVLYNLTHRIEN